MRDKSILSVFHAENKNLITKTQLPPPIFSLNNAADQWAAPDASGARARVPAPALSRFRRAVAGALLCLAAFVLQVAPAYAQIVGVPDDWALIPAGLSDGDKFRLLIVTSTTRDARQTNIYYYNSHVQGAVVSGHTAIRSRSSDFKVLGCTDSIDATVNTATTYTSANKGVPIYWLGGDKVADEYEDFYDGTWDSNTPRDENGNTITVQSPGYVFTGCQSDGTEGDELGRSGGVDVGRPAISGQEIHDGGSNESRTNIKQFYGLSPVFFVGDVQSQVECPNPSASPPTKKDILLKLYCDTDGDSWTDKSGWSTYRHPGNGWNGVTYVSAEVQRLDLARNNLTGAIPTQLGSLTDLTHLLLHQNQLSGTIPTELGNLAELQWLALYNNQLSGTIPTQLGSLTDLTHLLLHQNQLSGTIPTELGNLAELTRLYLNVNQLSGTIPTELGNLTELQILYLYDNQLSGAIPTQLGDLANLRWLNLYGNQLTGAIPTELGSLTKELQDLYLNQNQLTGTIPTHLGDLANLERLYLNQNQLSGAIPTELGSLTDLERLYLNQNQLSGTIPTHLGDLANLERLYLNQNQLSGTIPTELGSLTDLERLYLNQNQLSGTIPTHLGDLANLRWLNLYGNQLSGAIPTELGSLTDLERLYLNQNQLSGTIPTHLGDLANLRLLNLYGNQLSGAIPTELGSLTDLQWLLLSENQLSGAIPTELGSLTDLGRLLLSENQLSGAIPTELGSLTKELQDLYLNQNQLTGTIPAELGDLTNLKGLNLAANQLSGTIPAELGDLTDLEILNLHMNQLSGTIPAELGNLMNLRELPLNQNQMLHGELPLSLMDLSGLTTLNIENTEVCAPLDAAFQQWLGTITFIGKNCVPPPSLLPPPPPPPSEDFEALWELYWATGGGRWVNDINWLNYGPLSWWHGVTTDVEGRVTGLDLSGSNLSGELPDSLADLSSLQTLDLSDNPLLGGELPLGLMDLPYLTTLNIENTEACAPGDEAFQRWLGTIDFRGDVCGAPEEEMPEQPEEEDEEVPETGGGCAIASDEYKGTTPGSVVFNLLAVVSAVFLTASMKRR